MIAEKERFTELGALLNRELVHFGLLHDDATYKSKLLACLEVV